MLSRVSLDEFAASARRQVHGGRAQHKPPVHLEAFGEAGLVLLVTLSLATIAAYAARAMGWA